MSALKNILIVGGGTAGWMAANLMAKAWGSKGIKITLIESTKLGTIGVGEGSTPYLRNLFQRLSIPEHEWMPACHATYKCGISFPGWADSPGYESYFHPFYSMIDKDGAPKFFENCTYRRHGKDVYAHPDDFFVTSAIAKACKAPIAQKRLQHNVEYGYHFDAELLGRFLKKKAVSNGVVHLDDKVQDITLSSQGDITYLTTENSGNIYADFFIDCSGFKGLLIQKALGETLISKKSYLKCNSAVAIPTPLDSTKKIPSETVSQALKYGWVWNIPLTKRFGNGYVYCSDYISKEDAENELREHLGITDTNIKALHLNWTPGRIEQHWKKNCLAVGLSQGFLEPLEAPMLYLVQRTIENFIAYFEHTNFTNDLQPRFNREINLLIDGTVDYLQAHYKLNTRNDSKFWQDCRENTNMSASLDAIIKGWDSGDNFEVTMQQQINTQVYQRASWYCILSGMGRYPAITEPTIDIAEENHRKSKINCVKLSENFGDHSKHLFMQKNSNK